MKVKESKYGEVFLKELGGENKKKFLGKVKSQRWDKRDKTYKIVLVKQGETRTLELKKQKRRQLKS